MGRPRQNQCSTNSIALSTNGVSPFGMAESGSTIIYMNGAISEAAKDGVTDQNRESAAGQIVDRCRAEGDDEMQDDSQRRGACASAIRLQAEDTAGNGLRMRIGSW